MKSIDKQENDVLEKKDIEAPLGTGNSEAPLPVEPKRTSPISQSEIDKKLQELRSDIVDINVRPDTVSTLLVEIYSQKYGWVDVKTDRGKVVSGNRHFRWISSSSVRMNENGVSIAKGYTVVNKNRYSIDIGDGKRFQIIRTARDDDPNGQHFIAGDLVLCEVKGEQFEERKAIALYKHTKGGLDAFKKQKEMIEKRKTPENMQQFMKEAGEELKKSEAEDIRRGFNTQAQKFAELNKLQQEFDVSDLV